MRDLIRRMRMAGSICLLDMSWSREVDWLGLQNIHSLQSSKATIVMHHCRSGLGVKTLWSKAGVVGKRVLASLGIVVRCCIRHVAMHDIVLRTQRTNVRMFRMMTLHNLLDG